MRAAERTFKNLVTGLGLFTCSLAALSVQAQKAHDKKEQITHLSITQEINGKTIHVDTSYTPDQQQAITAYLKSLGIDLVQPSKQSHLSVPPPPPDAPLPPDAPEPPIPPTPPLFNMDDFEFHYDAKDMTKEDKEALGKELEKMKETLNRIEIPEIPDLPDFSNDIHIHIKGSGLSEEERQEFEKEMEQLNQEMKNLKENMKNLKIEIREELENEDEKEGGYRFQFKNNDLNEADITVLPRLYCYNVTGGKDNDASMNQVLIYKTKRSNSGYNKPGQQDAMTAVTKTAGSENSYLLKPETFNVYPNPGDGRFNLAFQLASTEPLHIKMMDTTGKLVYEENITDFNGIFDRQIDIAEKGKGIYLLSVTQGSRWMHKKIVVK